MRKAPALISARRAAALLAATGVAVALPAAAGAQTPTPSPGAATINKAGTSFLTAAGISPGQPVRVGASVGDYLYWSFTAAAGDTHHVAATVSLPAAASRKGDSTWTVEVFDGLRRRQACVAGAQTPVAARSAASVELDCELRRVRSWAEPWSGDPLPGTYYVRLSATELPEQELGLPIEVSLMVGVESDGDTEPEGGDLKQPLVPAVNPGKVLAEDSTPSTPDPAAAGDEEDGWFDRVRWPSPSSRWYWTIGGGILAAVAGVVGFALTRPRQRVG
ncbi:peptidase [Micromonospora sp. C31]|uniref:peptidase n=1 Tax=Micromonospora sp. C31 TaxID=2824876 RepID=UPI001B38FDC3|nr:peptidase [Micromonospora sp. C31]